MTISVQFLTMLAMIGMGSFFGAAFDTYNRFLKRAGRKRWIVFCNDILFLAFAGIDYILRIIPDQRWRAEVLYFSRFIVRICRLSELVAAGIFAAVGVFD